MSSVFRITKKLQWVFDGRQVSEQAVPSGVVHPRWAGVKKSVPASNEYVARNQAAADRYDFSRPNQTDMSQLFNEFGRPL